MESEGGRDGIGGGARWNRRGARWNRRGARWNVRRGEMEWDGGTSPRAEDAGFRSALSARGATRSAPPTSRSRRRSRARRRRSPPPATDLSLTPSSLPRRTPPARAQAGRVRAPSALPVCGSIQGACRKKAGKWSAAQRLGLADSRSPPLTRLRARDRFSGKLRKIDVNVRASNLAAATPPSMLAGAKMRPKRGVPVLPVCAH